MKNRANATQAGRAPAGAAPAGAAPERAAAAGPAPARAAALALLAALALAVAPAAFASEAQPPRPLSPLTEQFYSEYVRAFLNNEFLLENIRLVALAEERYVEGYYSDAFAYAQQAIRYARLSDEHVALQLVIRETDNAISSARFRLEWAARVRAPQQYPQLYANAGSAFQSALAARERESWAQAKAFAQRVIEILEGVTPILPAQFLVRTWAATRDCLWNIAALPEIFGDPTRWPALYQANRGRMPQPGNPDLILPGMILDIPSLAGETRYGLMDEWPARED